MEVTSRSGWRCRAFDGNLRELPLMEDTAEDKLNQQAMALAVKISQDFMVEVDKQIAEANRLAYGRTKMGRLKKWFRGLFK